MTARSKLRFATLLSALALATACGPRPYTSLSESAEPLRSQFNRDVGRTRIVMLVAPTCAQCLLGVAEMQREVLSKISDPDLRVYMVWVPKLRGLERDVASATTLYPEARAMHFWDAPSVLVRGYRETLKLPEDAWDVFLLYGPEVRWDDLGPPAPDYWAHQLGTAAKPRVHGPWLDGKVFYARLTGVRP